MSDASEAQPLSKLLETENPSWNLIQEWLRASPLKVEVLPPATNRDAHLEQLQVTTHSTLGGVAYESGGLLVDAGWVRILGSGHDRLPRSIQAWNSWVREQLGVSPGILFVADDILGGFFVLNGGALGQDVGNVYYYAPDRSAWEALGIGYTDFLHWTLSERLPMYYEDYRWPGWEEEVQPLPGDRVFSIYPPLWAEGPPIVERSRRDIPIDELFTLSFGAHEGGETESSDGG